MPAYAPPFNVLHKLSSRLEEALELQESMSVLQSDVNEMADSYQQWSEKARSSIAAIGKTLIPEGGVVFTFTLSETVLRTLLETWESGRRFKVLVTESRPNNDGRITAKSLVDKGIEVAISIDACMNELIPQADLMIVGAEAILADGSAICKVGTFPSALTAKQYQVPVYVLVDTMKFHVNSLLGKGASLDPIQADDVVKSQSPGPSNIEGHLFDRTPPEYISGLVTEQGLVHPSQVSHWMLTMPVSNSIVNRI
jgi:ribose 1,5-bisphosphate isomerase